jgi:phosphatidylethanolamine/phosphatidyl-N-methylethanolamine N-methyltransferase
MSLKHSYTLFAPIYDNFVGGVFDTLRKSNFAELQRLPLTNSKILLSGVGTGLDLPLLPRGPEYVGIDLTPAMLKKAHARVTDLNIELRTGNVMELPFDNNQFDAVIMHLILAVVPMPALALQEAQRVLKPGGYILVLDKFLRPGQLAPLRRLINPVIKRLATQTNIVFEELLQDCPKLKIIDDVPALGNGWFRRIVLQKFD